MSLDYRLVLEVWVVSELGWYWRLASGGGGRSDGWGMVLIVGLGLDVRLELESGLDEL